MPISEHNEKERQKVSPYEFRYFVLNDERSHLYERINARVDEMLAHGLVEEVRALKARGCTKDMVSMQGLGYKEILEYLEGTCTLEEAVYRLKRDTRHFAKRQITWFKRERDVIWIDKKNIITMKENFRYNAYTVKRDKVDLAVAAGEEMKNVSEDYLVVQNF